jgi:ferritin-like metal-binding protein YciE
MTYNNGNSELVVAWLRDAYAMERALVPVLENHAKDAERHPELRARLQQHATETKRQADRIEQCLRQLGQEPSTLKNTVSKVLGAIQSVATGAFKDDEVKNALQDYATQYFQIACYRSLIEAGKALQRPEIVEMCQQSLNEEEAMARFLEQQLPTIVHDALAVPA